MLNNREKEIIKILYYYFNNITYASTGPSWLSKKDYKAIMVFIDELKRGHSINE